MRSRSPITAAATGVPTPVLSLLTAPPAEAAPPGGAASAGDIGFGWWPYALGSP
ncbi:hypothetical protein [Streptomyces tibetensis]|uniref:hypothetical protein n=1 Tax=Streptomyces tibetensis TaxID=2382123 RepID=UPI0033E424EB